MFIDETLHRLFSWSFSAFFSLNFAFLSSYFFTWSLLSLVHISQLTLAGLLKRYVCFLCVYLSVCLSICLTVCLPVYLCVSLSIYLWSVPLSVCLSAYPHACLSVCLFICLSDCLSVCLTIRLSVCLSVCLYVCMYICLSVHLPIGNFFVSLSICLSAPLHVYLSVYLSVRLSFCLSVCLSVYLLVCLSICLPDYLSASLSVSLSVCIFVWPSICLPACCLSHQVLPHHSGRIWRRCRADPEETTAGRPARRRSWACPVCRWLPLPRLTGCAAWSGLCCWRCPRPGWSSNCMEVSNASSTRKWTPLHGLICTRTCRYHPSPFAPRSGSGRTESWTWHSPARP